MNNKISKCCSQPIIEANGKFFCAGVKGCGKYCDVIPHPTTSRGKECTCDCHNSTSMWCHRCKKNHDELEELNILSTSKSEECPKCGNTKYGRIGCPDCSKPNSSTRLENWEEPRFMECDSCRAKPGSPQLCWGCLHNRDIISSISTLLQEERERQKQEDIKLLQKELSRITDVPDNDYNQGLRRGFDRSILTLDQS